MGTQWTFPIFTFSDALQYLKMGGCAKREISKTELFMDESTIYEVDLETDKVSPWFPTHADILADDWMVINVE